MLVVMHMDCAPVRTMYWVTNVTGIPSYTDITNFEADLICLIFFQRQL